MNPFRTTLIALPLALALAACGDEAETAGSLSGEPVAEVPAPEGQSWLDTVAVSDADGYIVGNPDAPIKLIEYASYTCGACANFIETGVEPLKSEYVESGRVSFELRNLVRDPIDLSVAVLARCGSPESFHPLSEQVWRNFQTIMGGAQANGQAIEAAMTGPEDERLVGVAEAVGLIDFFASRGLSRDQARQCLADTDKVQSIAENSNTQASQNDVTGTPTFFINGQQTDARGWDQLEVALQEAGAR
ncbi:thioredoxin domain-containing protein [Altererythrobacter sp. MTPC7]|uniref:thioredoxin domain-containing protein n=1 Tax=Altererythrobacter sp. MTPC7 TaxID=3056567 RepID=UPI0036F3979B